MTTSGLTVLIADDQPIIRAGLRDMIDGQGGLAVVGTAADGAQAVQAAADLRPDVVLMDIRMPVLDGIEATRRIIAAQTARAVVMITTFDDEEYLLDSARAGASGFLLKDVGVALLTAAVHSAARGDALIDPIMTRALLERFVRSTAPTATASQTSKLESLTAREREILGHLARGVTNTQLARELYVSEPTVKTHISHILGKIGGRTRVDAVIFAYESGVAQPRTT